MAKPYVRVLVDWEADGNYTGTYDNITDDIRTMSFSHTRQKATEYMNGGILNLQLNNNDHKYSPPYYPSPLQGKLIAGKDIKVLLGYPYDDFVDTTDTVLTSHTIPYDSGFSWVNDTGAFKCHADGYAQINTGADSYSYIDMGEVEVEVEAEITTSALGTTSTYESGLILKYVDTNNYYYLRIVLASNQIELRKVIATTDSSVGYGSYTWGGGNKKTISAKIHGDSIRVYIDDVALAWSTGETFHAITGATALDAGTKFGIWTRQHATDAKIHHFGAVRPLFKGKLKELTPRPQKGMQYCYMKAYDLFEELKLSRGYGYLNPNPAIRSNGGLGGYALQPIDLSGANILDKASASYQYLTKYYSGGGTANQYLPVQFYDGQTVLEATYRIQDAEDGFIYVDGRGYIHFEERGHRNEGAHLVKVGTYKDSYDGSNAGYRHYAYDDGVDGVYNSVEIGYQAYRSKSAAGTDSLTAGDTAWELRGTPAITAGETKHFIIEAKNYGGNSDQPIVLHGVAGGNQTVSSPTSSDRVQINTAEDGTGSLLGFITVMDDYQKYGGPWHAFTLKNNTASDGYITKLISNMAIYNSDRAKGMIIVEDTDSQAIHGVRKLTREDALLDDPNNAESCANSKLTRLRDPLVRMRLDLINHDKSTLMNIVHRKLSDLVQVVETGMGVGGYSFIDGYQYKFYNGNTVIEQTVHVTQAGVGQSGRNWNTAYWDGFGWS